MSAIGADLPPHLIAKRKRQQEEDLDSSHVAASSAERPSSSDGPDKRRKIIGPAMPPAPLEERPAITEGPANEESSEDDDDIGPALPSTGAITRTMNEDEIAGLETSSTKSMEEKPQRDEWMMMPPKQDDLAARLDPTKQRPTKFNTGRGARAGETVADSSTWHETPEQKRKRLEDEMMGISKPAATIQTGAEKASKRAEDMAAHRMIQKHNESRGPSLVEQHRQSKGAEAEDDPSKRAFDREKDMASGSRISSSQKREMLKKAGGFSGKFSGGSYL